MKQEEKNIVMQQMAPYLSNEQAIRLRNVLEQLDQVAPSELDNEVILQNFLNAKELEGCSTRTLEYYEVTLRNMMKTLQKDVRGITTEDLREYLTKYPEKNGASRATLNNIRRNLSSFFHWLEDENYILKSPVRRIHRFKTTTTVKETYSDEDIEKLRDSCNNLRDLAIIDLLASTGMRVGELVLLNRDDIDFSERECVVFGKGDKERVVYLDAKANIHLKNYLDSRTDSNDALFVSRRKPCDRLQIGGVEVMLRKKGAELGINKVHPHKFRRTLVYIVKKKSSKSERFFPIFGKGIPCFQKDYVVSSGWAAVCRMSACCIR